MAGPGRCQPASPVPLFGVAFGMVYGASDRSPTVISFDLCSWCRFRYQISTLIN
ncbi:hypothetical protein DY000_02032101 [Brassica cretica]|uniref:Uncharacterized protein n=1 Tax=Brassica cretica TaxID=69181 RepID=A0ABQ7DPU7_BRACR|nr:hypothetical protein DY000_02032101 [Brassica cretica]